MKFKFRKIASVLGSLALVGSSMGMAMAIYPSSFQNSNGVALVYGSNAAQSDLDAVNSMNTNLASYIDSLNLNQSINLSDSSFITENEVVLGTLLNTNGRLKTTITDNKLDSLKDGKIYWDDGDSSKSFNIHEEILLGNMKIITTLDDDDLNKTALTNDKGLEYRYIFDDNLDTDKIGSEDADVLKIELLGKEYNIDSFNENSMVVSVAKESVVKKDDTLSYDGNTLTIQDIFDDAIQINGVIVNEGRTKKVGNLEVYLKDIAYHSSDTKPSKAIIEIGTDLKKTIDDGDYYGNDEDSEWVWTINNPGQKGGYIGIKYDESQIDPDDNLVYEGGSYTFPEDYVSVRFDKLTEVDYGKFELSFDEENLYNNSEGNERIYNDANVLVLKGPTEDSFEVGDVETNELYLKYNNGIGNIIHHDAIIDGTILFPEWNQTEISGELELTKKNISSWEPIENSEVKINYTVQGESFNAIVPSGYTLVYYPDMGNNFTTNVNNILVYGIDEFPSLPIIGDINEGAKLWLLPGTLNSVEAKTFLTNWNTNAPNILFENNLITYNDEPILIHHDAVINETIISPEWDEVVTTQSIEVYTSDVDKDYSDSVKPRWTMNVSGDNSEIGKLIYGDTELSISINVNGSSRVLSVGDLSVTINENGDFKYLGSDEEDAESSDVILENNLIGNRDNNNILSHSGVLVKNVESNADNDEVSFEIPDEEVFGEITISNKVIKNQEQVTPLDVVIIKDTEIESFNNRDLIIVGGSCINKVAAKVLGVSENTCGADFTNATGIGTGQYLTKEYTSPYNSERVAYLVAGYEAVDTTSAMNSILYSA